MSIYNPVSPSLPESLLHGTANELLYLTRKLESRAGAAADGKDTKPLTVLEEGCPLELIDIQKVIVEVWSKYTNPTASPLDPRATYPYRAYKSQI